ncbi:very short patch repair endonuclease [Ferribacterium limneticum]|uniref:very short patch repair endonuclease n=1 Tax=Ferribacterium limneticum TaxID=76259 RepID=UPI001CF8E338|nr:DNA mismatch endonuclease Vsr [Ferribacterium limneticum]
MKSRSEIMRSVRRENTTPELLVRRVLHSFGLRFRLYRKDLPGSPDIVLPKFRTAIFVHGCFWHRHEACHLASTPKTNQDYWLSKFKANIERDTRNTQQLEAMGWNVLVLWECETRNHETLSRRLLQYFPAHRQALAEHD